MVIGCKFRRELIENVSCVSEPGQEDNRSPGPTPIEHLQPGVAIYGYKLHVVWRWVAPSGGFLCTQMRYERNDGQKNGTEQSTIDH